MSVLPEIGFASVGVRARFDLFRGTSKEKTARKHGVAGVTVYAEKPPL